jgi:hypothetical protein
VQKNNKTRLSARKYEQKKKKKKKKSEDEDEIMITKGTQGEYKKTYSGVSRPSFPPVCISVPIAMPLFQSPSHA